MAYPSATNDKQGQLLFSAAPAMDYYDKSKSATNHHDRLTAFYALSAPKPRDSDKKLIGRSKGFKVL
jgi:hypothetical protein